MASEKGLLAKDKFTFCFHEDDNSYHKIPVILLYIGQSSYDNLNVIVNQTFIMPGKLHFTSTATG